MTDEEVIGLAAKSITYAETIERSLRDKGEDGVTLLMVAAQLSARSIMSCSDEHLGRSLLQGGIDAAIKDIKLMVDRGEASVVFPEEKTTLQ